MSARAQALLRALGGGEILARFADIPAGDDGEELGLASPEFREVALRPVLVRQQAGRTVVLLDAGTAEAALGTTDVKPALLSASGVVVCGEPFGVESVERRTSFGRPYLYRLLLAAPAGRTR